MPEMKGRAVILQLQKKWTYQGLLFNLLIAFAIALPVLTGLHQFLLIPFYWGIPLCIIVFLLMSVINRWWKLSELDISRFLNQSEPLLQESTELVLKPYDTLNLLQKLQLQKVETQLFLLKKPNPLKRKLIIAAFALLTALVICAGLFSIPVEHTVSNQHAHRSPMVAGKTVVEVTLPEVTAVKITIAPPAYTNKASRTQDKYTIEVEEGSVVVWSIETNIAAKDVQLIFNDGIHLPLVASSTNQKNFKTQKTISKPGFYQLQIGDQVSELYKIEVIKDKPPSLVIQTPKPNTTIDYGQPQHVSVKVTVTDDYGIKAASISATTSSGEGEGVKFKEQNIKFENFMAGRRQYSLQKTIDCKALGMQPGDELYFFITATDTHNQEVRSDVFIVTSQDTTQLMSMDGLMNGLDVKPELFRSQRQIIIETEQLLKDKASITVEEFKKRSNDLGVDQKLLRLRYGKFLGEETDNEIGSHDHEESGVHEGNTDNAAEIMEQYGHMHDNAEDATFFDAATKKQLKATLAEMWNAELQLRTYKPAQALPFEYKALLLLKDLQQKSRAYVAKTGFKSTPLKTDKRLTGDLSKITTPVIQRDFEKNNSPEVTVRQAIGILEQLKNDGIADASSKELLQQAFQQLSSKAAQNPSLFLPSLSSFKKILDDRYSRKDINAAQNGLQEMLAPATKLPYSPNAMMDMNLSRSYFMNLNKGNRQK